MSAGTWDQDGDPYRRWVDSQDAESATRYRLAKQRQHGEDVDYFARRALVALTDQASAEQRAATLTAQCDQQAARIADLEAELGDLTADDTGDDAVTWYLLLGAGFACVAALVLAVVAYIVMAVIR